jgi:hypothetical protein
MRYLFLLLSFILFIGCHNSNPQGRISVRGEVTYDNKPLEKGDILFTSVEGTSPAVTTGTLIKNGKYALTAEHGLIPEQTYIVRFRSMEPIEDENEKPKVNEPAADRRQGIPFQVNVLPRKYGAASKETVTATKKSTNIFNFDLTSDTGK